MICRRCIVTGRVQGVFYRDSTRRKANELGVSGSARNRADGAVEVVACGDELAVTTLCEWLWEGPEYAQVRDVKCLEAGAQEHAGFVIG